MAWTPEEGIRPGQRVWVADATLANGKAWGAVIAVDDGHNFLSSGKAFVVRLDGGNRVILCSAAARGLRWDFAPATD
jgi:hypothetical protein